MLCVSFLFSQEEMENKAMYLSTYEERESGSMYEEAYDGRNLSKLNLCDEGEKERLRVWGQEAENTELNVCVIQYVCM